VRSRISVLAVAYAVVPLQDVYSARDERELVLAGFVTFFDPPMEGASPRRSARAPVATVSW